MTSPQTAVFTTVRAKNGHLFHLDLHMERLAKHAEILGLEVPDIDIPENLDGLVKIEINISIESIIISNIFLSLLLYDERNSENLSNIINIC